MNPDDLTKKHDNSLDESPLDVKQSSQKRDCEDVPNEDLLLRRKRIRETMYVYD